MKADPRPYAGALIAFATMHGKEALAQQPFRDILGASVVAPAGLNTDQFGTFSGEIPRILTPHAAARAKVHLGIHLSGTLFGLASEGSFGSGFGPLVEHHEILMFVDVSRGLELIEGTILTSPIPAGHKVMTVDAAVAYAGKVNFPTQGLVIRGGSDPSMVTKNFDSIDTLTHMISQLLQQEPQVTIEPDYRAHRCPSRADTIRTLSARMAQRLDMACEQCETPGFGRLDIERGLRCTDCGLPTQLIAADIHGCGSCAHTVRIPRPEQSASPRWCDSCNP